MFTCRCLFRILNLLLGRMLLKQLKGIPFGSLKCTRAVGTSRLAGNLLRKPKTAWRPLGCHGVSFTLLLFKAHDVGQMDVLINDPPQIAGVKDG